jgi:FKBP-type peptidyl-prolyl cis-trans isomerase 2
MSYQPGDAVTVQYEGYETNGTVIETAQHSDFVLCQIRIDPNWDHGRIGEDLGIPYTYLNFRAKDVRKTEQ